MVGFDRYVLRLFDVKHGLKDGESVPDAEKSHRLEVFMLQSNKGLANNLVFYKQTHDLSAFLRIIPLHHHILTHGIVTVRCLPMKISAYCCSPMLAIKSAHSSAFHSEIIVSGKRSALER